MLLDLSIRNFAIIDELQVSFGRGFNLISGETGAGKSIIIGAISLLLGDRASMEMIRSEEETATVEACFDIAGMESLKVILAELGLENGDELYIRRMISRSGKNKVLINGSMGNLGMLSAICGRLLNLSGQHEHQMLLHKENHLDILDDFGGLQPLRREYHELYGRYLSLQAELTALCSQQALYEAEEELHRFQLKEIVGAGIQAGEDERLLEEKKIITHAQKLLALAETAHERLYGQQGAVLEGLRLVLNSIKEINKIDEGMKIAPPAVEQIYYQLEDMASVLRDYGKSLFFDPHRLETMEERLELLGQLKRKYGGTLEEISKKQAFLEKSCHDKSVLCKELEKQTKARDELKIQLHGKAKLLSAKRTQAAARLQSAIDTEMRALKMEKASFFVIFQVVPDSEDTTPHAKGFDDVEFYLAPNAGEEMKPLARIASGGELSRIVLAIKKVLANSSAAGTLIFDEVDSGIGGAVAEIVGEKLWDISRRYQVICITHLPQIACFAHRHFLVAKQVVGESTRTVIRSLAEGERLDEVARMLAGVELTEKTREHAREMLDAARLHRGGEKDAEKSTDQ
ncbi:MAG: DNA repair protein RecN [Syntrophales bacterium]